MCADPGTSPLDLANWFATPKPNPLPPPKQPTGERLKILHLSDLHIDPRKLISLLILVFTERDVPEMLTDRLHDRRRGQLFQLFVLPSWGV